MTVNKITNAPTQNEIINSINDLIDNKQDTISDLSTIRSNAANGQSAYTTIGGYGDIVTYNASNFVQKNGDSSTQTISLTSGTGTTALGIKSMATSSYLSLSGSSGWLGSYGVSSSKRAVFYNGTGYTLAYTSEIPTNTSDLTNDSGYITGINSSDVITALGYTPYNSTNPNGYTSNVGTVTSVNNTQPDANGNVTIQAGGATDVQINGTSITSGGVANIVTNTAYNASSNKIATMSDLPSGGANTDLSNLTATGEAHFLKSINSTDVINALGYTPENQANKVTSISSSSTNTQYPSAKSVIELLKTIYPVGSVYLSTNSICPLSSLFGTWTLVSSGRALWTGTGSNGNTTIAAGLPNIKGGVTQYKTTHTSGSSFSDGALAEIYNKTGGGYSSSNSKNVYNISFNAASSNSIYSDSVTTVQPPAYVVNVWRRTA